MHAALEYTALWAPSVVKVPEGGRGFLIKDSRLAKRVRTILITTVGRSPHAPYWIPARLAMGSGTNGTPKGLIQEAGPVPPGDGCRRERSHVPVAWFRFLPA